MVDHNIDLNKTALDVFVLKLFREIKQVIIRYSGHNRPPEPDIMLWKTECLYNNNTILTAAKKLKC